MSMNKTCAISSAISFLTSAAISWDKQCANPCLTSSEEDGFAALTVEELNR